MNAALSKQTFAHAQLCIQNGTTSGATYGVMGKQDKFIAEDGAYSESANSGGHSTSRITVKQCLWTIRFSAIDKGMRGSAG